MTTDELVDLMKQHSATPEWYGEGIWWKADLLPDCKDKTVLDIGCHDGYLSFLAEMQGASSITSLDWIDRPCFEKTKAALGSKCEFKKLDVHHLGKLKGKFDVVIFIDVYYHLEDPLLVLRRIRRKTKGTLVFGGYVLEERFASSDKPIMYMFKPGECYNDPTNHCGANLPCLELMLKKTGFDVKTINRKWDRVIIIAE